MSNNKHASLDEFLKLYFPETFYLPWTDQHHELMSLLHLAIVHGHWVGGVFPRGIGLTSICEGAAIWAAVRGHRWSVELISNSRSARESMLESITWELKNNDRLVADYLQGNPRERDIRQQFRPSHRLAMPQRGGLLILDNPNEATLQKFSRDLQRPNFSTALLRSIE